MAYEDKEQLVKRQARNVTGRTVCDDETCRMNRRKSNLPACMKSNTTRQVVDNSPHTLMTLHKEEDQPGRQCQASPEHPSVQRSHAVTE